jgi:hypothetical protein
LFSELQLLVTLLDEEFPFEELEALVDDAENMLAIAHSVAFGTRREM